MTPEQIERVMELVREYGKQLMFFGMHGDKRYQHLSVEVIEQIEAELKGEGTDG